MRNRLCAALVSVLLLGAGSAAVDEAASAATAPVARTCPQPSYVPCEPVRLSVSGPERVSAAEHAVYRVRAMDFAGTRPATGKLTVTVRPGGHQAKVRRLSPGRWRVTVPRLKPGRYRVAVHLEPNGPSGDATRITVLRVTRKGR